MTVLRLLPHFYHPDTMRIASFDSGDLNLI